MHLKTKVPLLLSITLILAWCSACWVTTGIWFDLKAQESYQTERLRAEYFVSQASSNFERIITSHTGGPQVFARGPDILHALTRFATPHTLPQDDETKRQKLWSTDPELSHLNQQLKLASQDLGLDSLELLDANGYCLAASHPEQSPSPIGTYDGDREDFLAARLNRSGYLVSVNPKNGNAQLTYYAPVITQGQVIGTVSGTNTLAPFANLLDDQTEAFLSDYYGVVLLTREPSFMLNTLPDTQVNRLDAATRLGLYQHTEFTSLKLSPVEDLRFPELLHVPHRDAPALLRSQPVGDGELSVNVLWPMPQLKVLAQQRVLTASALGTVGTLGMLLFTVLTGRRREQRLMAHTLVMREQLAVTQAHEFLKQIINAIADPVVVKDQDGRWVWVNQAFCNFMGYPHDDFIGKTVHDLLPEGEARRVQDTDERVLTAGTTCISEDKITDRHNRTHIVVTKKNPCTDAHGNLFLVGILSDISERKKVERLLRTKEREFSSLAENLPVAVIRYDSECRRRYLNPCAEKMLRIDKAELLGLEPGGPNIPATPAMVEVYRSKLQQVLTTHTTHELDFVLDAHQTESAKHYEVRLVPEHDADGQTVSVLTIWHDITARKQLENELTQREAEFRALAENLPSPVFRYDRECRRLYVNPAGMRLTAMSQEQLLGHLPTNCANVTPNDAANTMAAIRKVIATGKQLSFYIEYHHNGSSSEYQGVMVPEFNANAEVVTVLSMAHDVTALRHAERHAASFFANMPGFAFTLRSLPDGRLSLPFASSGIEDIYGLRPEDVRDDATPMHALEHPDDRARIQAASTMTAQTQQALQPFQLEFRIQRPGHPQRWIECRSMPHRQADGTVLWHGIMLDITERKRMAHALAMREQEFRNLAESSPDHIVRYDRDGRMLYLNTALMHLLGLPGAQVALGKRPCEVVRHASIEAVEHAASRVLVHARKEVIEIVMPNERGEHRIHQIAIVPERDVDAQVIGTLAFGRDITAVREVEQRLVHFLDNLPGLAYTFRRSSDGRGGFPYVSPAIGKLYGLKPAQVRDNMTAAFSLVHPDDRIRIEAAMAEAEQTHTPFQIEARVCRPGHPECWLDVRSVPEPQADGSMHWYGLMLDITSRKQAEKKLKDALALNEGIINALPDILFELDRHGRYLNCWSQNPDMQTAQKAAVLGKTVYDVLTPENADIAMATLREADEKGFAYGTVLCIVQADGQARWYEHSLTKKYGPAPTEASFLVLSRDITTLKNTELALRASEALTQSRNALLQTIIESSPDIIVFALDTTYCYLAFNRKHQETMQALWGKKIDIGMSMLEVIGDHPDREAAHCSMDRALAGESFLQEESYGDEARMRQYWQNYWSPIRSAAGEVVGLTCFVLNYSEQKKAEDCLRHSHAVLRALAAHKETKYAKQRKELSHQIHEDLAQNLTALRLNLSALEKYQQPGDHAQMFQTINNITERCIARIRDIVSVLRPTVLDLGLVPALHWLINDFKGIGFQFETALQEDVQINDEASTVLFRATQETLLNAALHAGATQIQIAFNTVAGSYRLVIRDNGCGFDPAQTPREGRFGLIDLAEQAHHLGGELSINSHPGQGTELCILLPVTQENTAAALA